jgi:hypothetical protein
MPIEIVGLGDPDGEVSDREDRSDNQGDASREPRTWNHVAALGSAASEAQDEYQQRYRDQDAPSGYAQILDEFPTPWVFRAPIRGEEAQPDGYA